MSQSLRLAAVDAEDLAVIATCLQDALVLVGDMAFLPKDHRFVLVANRFVWESKAEDGSFARTNAGLVFDKVKRVQRRNIDLAKQDAILSLLTIQAQPGWIELTFAGDASIRLEAAEIQCRLEDLDEPWPTPWKPKHKLD